MDWTRFDAGKLPRKKYTTIRPFFMDDDVQQSMLQLFVGKLERFNNESIFSLYMKRTNFFPKLIYKEVDKPLTGR